MILKIRRFLHTERKRFKEIPGPKSLPLIGTLWNYLPVIGNYKFDMLHINGLKKLEKFGPIVREEIVLGVNLVWIYKPDDIKELFKVEGRYPQRRSHLALQHYRKSRPDIYNTGGLLPTNGPEWWKLRSVFQKSLSQPQKVKFYLPLINDVGDDFVRYISKTKPPIFEDFLPFLSRIYLEMLGLVAFDVRLDSLSTEEMKPDSTSSKLIEAALTTNSCILKTDNGPQLWRKIETPLYKKLKTAHGYLDKVALTLIQRKMEELKNKKSGDEDKAELSLLEIYLKNSEINFKDVVGMSADMLLAGIDTTTYSTSFCLHHLSTNKEKQEKLYKEALEVLPKKDSPVTSEVLSRCQYLKATIKESFRLNPISVGIGRVLTEDAVFSGFHVPKETVVVTQNQVVTRLEEYFKQPNSFVPERWLKSDEKYENINPYLVLPFGHGPRTCIARRLAEQNMQVLILKLCRNFEMTWRGGTLESRSLLINKPDGPIKLAFSERA